MEWMNGMEEEMEEVASAAFGEVGKGAAVKGQRTSPRPAPIILITNGEKLHYHEPNIYKKNKR